MQNISIPDIIANLKGRRGYEEKKAKKLGYDCLETVSYTHLTLPTI